MSTVHLTFFDIFTAGIEASAIATSEPVVKYSTSKENSMEALSSTTMESELPTVKHVPVQSYSKSSSSAS